MKIPGTTKVQLSLLMILAISSVTSTVLQIKQQVRNTSVESTSYRNGNLRVEREELLLSQIGRSIMEVPQNSNPTYPDMERTTFPERLCHFIPLSERLTTKKPSNCS